MIFFRCLAGSWLKHLCASLHYFFLFDLAWPSSAKYSLQIKLNDINKLLVVHKKLRWSSWEICITSPDLNTRTWTQKSKKQNTSGGLLSYTEVFCKIGALKFAVKIFRNNQRRIKNLVRHLRWSILRKQLTASSC